MAQYTVDRSALESKPTEEIIRILKHERDDYTEEAIEIFEEILEERGYGSDHSQRGRRAPAEGSAPMIHMEDYQINSPREAIAALNHLLQGVMDGSIDLQKAQVASNLIMGLLHALEREFMTDSGEPPPVR